MYECTYSLGAPVPPVHVSPFCLTHESNDSGKAKSIRLNTSQNCKLVALHKTIKRKMCLRIASNDLENFATRSRNTMIDHKNNIIII